MSRRALVLCALTGCARAASVPTPAPAVGPAASVTPTPASNLAQRLGELRDTLAPRGVSFQGVASAGFIAHGGHVVTAFEVPAGRCLSVVALASGGVHDLDAQLYDPDGDMLVEDVETDSHPTVLLCAEAPRRVFHMISAYEGNGAYAVGSFLTNREGLDTISRAVGGHPGTAGAVGSARSDLERRVSALRDGIARRGFQPTGDPTRINVGASGRVRAPFPVTPDRCYTFGAFADGDLADVNALILDASGDEVARDLRDARDALVQVCPRVATTLVLEAQAARGDGAVVLQAWSADAAAVGGPTALWLGERLAWQGTAGTVEESLREGSARAEAAGLRAGATPDERMTLAAGDVMERTRRVNATGCTGFLATAGRGAGRIELSLHGADGALVARGEQGLGGALAVTCAPRSDALMVRVALEAGTGEVVLRTLGGEAPAWAAGADAAMVSERWAAQWLHAESRWTMRGAPVRVRVGGGARPVQSLEHAPGRCVRGALVAGSGVPSLSLALRDGEGRSLQRAAGEGRAVIGRCGATAESLRVELGADGVAEAWWMVWDERERAAAP
ncbi:MAG: hypothetical protein U0325_20115 [Polyangiales bacterium]